MEPNLTTETDPKMEPRPKMALLRVQARSQQMLHAASHAWPGALNGTNGTSQGLHHGSNGAAGPSHHHVLEKKSEVHATAGVYNSIDVEQRAAAVDGQTSHASGEQIEMRDPRLSAWPGFSEVLAVQSAETEPHPTATRPGCFIPDWNLPHGAFCCLPSVQRVPRGAVSIPARSVKTNGQILT